MICADRLFEMGDHHGVSGGDELPLHVFYPDALEKRFVDANRRDFPGRVSLPANLYKSSAGASPSRRELCPTG